MRNSVDRIVQTCSVYHLAGPLEMLCVERVFDEFQCSPQLTFGRLQQGLVTQFEISPFRDQVSMNQREGDIFFPERETVFQIQSSGCVVPGE